MFWNKIQINIQDCPNYLGLTSHKMWLSWGYSPKCADYSGDSPQNIYLSGMCLNTVWMLELCIYMMNVGWKTL